MTVRELINYMVTMTDDENELVLVSTDNGVYDVDAIVPAKDANGKNAMYISAESIE